MESTLDERDHMKFEFLFQHPQGASSHSQATSDTPSWSTRTSTKGIKSEKGFPQRHATTHRIVQILLLLELFFSVLSVGLILLSMTIWGKSKEELSATNNEKTTILARISLCVILSVNVLTALNVCCRMRDGQSCASTLMIHVIWKIILCTVLMPTVALFSFIRFEEYINSWPSRWLGVKILMSLWLYSVFSVGSIVLLAGLARGMWAKKARLRRSSVDSKICIIGSSMSNELVTLSSIDLFTGQHS
ncbi:unnamed protein product, partial [Mesorhabditis belari]|uniref:Uncharacterized protein n=1 Tax=Mesorhabditis belari TaxID=2138241 RepID=A0AAF3J4K7_9BILA